MRVRNTIIILDKVAEFFPAVSQIGIGIEKKIKQLLEDEKREDLKVLLSRYSAALTKNKPTWVISDKFRQVAVCFSILTDVEYLERDKRTAVTLVFVEFCINRANERYAECEYSRRIGSH